MKMGRFPTCVIMMAVLGYVSSQEYARLGIFNIPFEIILTNQDPADMKTLLSTPTTGGTMKTPVVSLSASSSSFSSSSSSSDVTSSSTSSIASSEAATAVPSSSVGAKVSVEAEIISEALLLKLEEQFASITTGYLATSKPELTRNVSSTLTFQYIVVYDKTLLNDFSYLRPGSPFIDQLYDVVTAISIWNWNSSITDGYLVDSLATQGAMYTAIAAVNTNFANVVWLCYGNECNDSATDCVVEGNKVACADKCSVFEAENNCTSDPEVDGVYLRGTCKMDKYGNAYCDCGMSPGDVMHNFFDGRQCVSVTFIVAMAASAGGFLFLLLLIALCALCNRKESRKGSSPRGSSPAPVVHATHNGYNEPRHSGQELNHRSHSKEYGSPKELRRTSSLSNHGYDVTRSPKEYRRTSSFYSNAYDVTKESNVEFKSIRL